MHRSEKCGEGRIILVWRVDRNVGGGKTGVPPKPLHLEIDRTFVAFRRRLYAKIVRFTDVFSPRACSNVTSFVCMPRTA